jgi:hypothetical protein
MPKGTYTKKYTFVAPLQLPLFVKVDFIFNDLVVGSKTQIVEQYGELDFSLYLDREDLTVSGMSNILYFQDGDGWSSTIFRRVLPYAFNFPFCFSGSKIGWR